jgi:hypothetical protein
MAPVVSLDFRPGGKWEASYDPKARLGDASNILNEVVTYLPQKMLAIRVVRTPPDFRHPEVAKSVWTVMEIDDLGYGRTRVTISMAGWKSGPEWDAVYRFFEWGDAQTLQQLQPKNGS